MILITRPEEESQQLAQILESKNFDCLIEPMLIIEYLKPDLPKIMSEPVQSFIATSKHGKRFTPSGQALTSIPEQGRNAHELYEWILKNLSPKKGKLVYLRGDVVTFDTASSLRQQGFQVDEVITYHAVPAHDFSPMLLQNFAKINLALFFSKKTLANFLKLIEKNKLQSALKKIRFLCISEEVAGELKNVKTRAKYTSDTPDLNGMISKIDEIY